MEVKFGESCTVELQSKEVSTRDLVKEKVELADLKGEDNPIYIADLGDVIHKYRAWTRHLPTVKPFFAVKSNDNQAVLKTLANLGVNFDCASKIEIERVLELRISPDRIIYGHTCKHGSMLQYAADNGVSMTTFDNEEELHKIKRIHPTAKCIIRIRPSTKYKVKLQLGKKFGCHPNEVAHLLKTALSLGLNVIGVSFHVGFLCEDPNAYADAISRCKTVIDTGKDLGIDMKILDIGGGFPGKDLKGSPRFEDIAAAINQSLSNHFHDNKSITFIAEPGEYFVASAFTLATKIIARKIELHKHPIVGINLNGINGIRPDDVNISTPDPATDHLSRDHIRYMYYLNDGIYGQLRIVTDYEGHGIRPYQLKIGEATKYESCLWGPTCDSLDVVFDSVQLQEHDVGEWLYFPNMGAYTVTLASTFNGMPSPTIHYLPRGTMYSNSQQTKSASELCLTDF